MNKNLDKSCGIFALGVLIFVILIKCANDDIIIFGIILSILLLVFVFFNSFHSISQDNPHSINKNDISITNNKEIIKITREKKEFSPQINNIEKKYLRNEILILLKHNIEKSKGEQASFKFKIDQLYGKLKYSSQLQNALENFFPTIPLCILLYKNCYTYFEYLLWKNNDIGREILWSSSRDLLLLNNLFPNESFSKLYNQFLTLDEKFIYKEIKQNQDSIDN